MEKATLDGLTSNPQGVEIWSRVDLKFEFITRELVGKGGRVELKLVKLGSRVDLDCGELGG